MAADEFTKTPGDILTADVYQSETSLLIGQPVTSNQNKGPAMMDMLNTMMTRIDQQESAMLKLTDQVSHLTQLLHASEENLRKQNQHIQDQNKVINELKGMMIGLTDKPSTISD